MQSSIKFSKKKRKNSPARTNSRQWLPGNLEFFLVSPYNANHNLNSSSREVTRLGWRLKFMKWTMFGTRYKVQIVQSSESASKREAWEGGGAATCPRKVSRDGTTDNGVHCTRKTSHCSKIAIHRWEIPSKTKRKKAKHARKFDKSYGTHRFWPYSARGERFSRSSWQCSGGHFRSGETKPVTFAISNPF